MGLKSVELLDTFAGSPDGTAEGISASVWYAVYGMSVLRDGFMKWNSLADVLSLSQGLRWSRLAPSASCSSRPRPSLGRSSSTSRFV